MNDAKACRILAVTVRSDRFGYAVFESRSQLLDFGISNFGSRASARERVRALLKRFRPSILATDTGGTRGPQAGWRPASIIRMIRRQCRQESVAVAVMAARELRAFFRQHGKRNKYDFAVLAASWFPEVVWKVPPKRKPYNPEPWVMTSIDAVILGAAYLTRNGNSVAKSMT